MSEIAMKGDAEMGIKSLLGIRGDCPKTNKLMNKSNR